MNNINDPYSARIQSEYRRREIEPKIALINFLIGIVIVALLAAAYSFMEADRQEVETLASEAQKALSSNDAYLKVAELREAGILNDSRHLAMPLQTEGK